MTRSARATRPEASRGDLAYANLRAAIQSGRLRAGDRIGEADIAKWLGVSRTPVRDALRRLESEGVLKSAPRRGLVVAGLSQQQVAEIYAVRDVLEGLVARLAAQHATPAEIAAMRELLQRQGRTQADAVPVLDRLNQLFHDVMHSAARNQYLINILDAFENSLALLPGTTYSWPGRATTAFREHTRLVDAIERHELDRAEELARQHIRGAERIRQLMISSGDLETGKPPRKTRAARRGR